MEGPGVATPVRPAMRVYEAEGGGGRNGGPRKRRRWLRWFAWSFGILLVAAAVLGAGAYVWFKQKYDRIVSVNNPADQGGQQALNAIQAQVPTGAKQPVVIAVMGYDARPGDKQAHSDTFMLLRLDPRKKIVTMLSFPRDLLVDVPGYGTRIITESYFLGGPGLALQTMRNLTGIRPNYYIRINFQGFIRTVDAFGGVDLDIDRHYFNKNDGTAAHNYVSIDIQPGYQRLSGENAILYVRYRHTDDDTVRLARQQQFVREFKHKIDVLNTAKNIIDLINIASDNIKVIGRKAMSEDQMLTYARTLQAVPKANIRQYRILGAIAPQDRNHLVPVQSEIDQDVAQFMNPQPNVDIQAANQTAPPAAAKAAAPALYKPARTPIDVRNGNGVTGTAPAAEAALQARGWKLAVANGVADSDRYFQSTIYYGPAATSKPVAVALAKLFGDAVAKPLTSAVKAGIAANSGVPVKADIVAVVGQTYSDLSGTPVTKTVDAATTKATMVADSSRDLAAYRAAQRAARLRLYYPRALPSGTRTGDPVMTSDSPFRAYTTAHHRALHVVYNKGGVQGTFGFQAIAWPGAPILDGATTTRTRRGVKYELYYNGEHLHRVAWIVNGIAYWLSNSLTDHLSNDEMWRTATSFVPVPRAG